MDKTIIIYDLETTGLIKNDEIPYITQISALVYKFKNPDDQTIYNRYIRQDPGVTIDQEASDITNITINKDGTLNKNNFKIEKQYFLKYVINEFVELIKKKSRSDEIILIAHNGMSFDNVILKFYLEHFNSLIDLSKIFYTDTMIYSYMLFPKSKNLKLTYIYNQLIDSQQFTNHNRISQSDFHNALFDVEATKAIFNAEVSRTFFIEQFNSGFISYLFSPPFYHNQDVIILKQHKYLSKIRKRDSIHNFVLIGKIVECSPNKFYGTKIAFPIDYMADFFDLDKKINKLSLTDRIQQFGNNQSPKIVIGFQYWHLSHV